MSASVTAQVDTPPKRKARPRCQCPIQLQSLLIDHSSHLPVYAQIKNALEREIASGNLPPGAPLPTVKSLAEHCGTTTATVMRALRDLADLGLTLGRRGSGTVVAPIPPPSTEILLPMAHGPDSPRLISYYEQLAQSLRQCYGSENRRVLVTHVGATSATEIIKVCKVRRTDGIIALRPDAKSAAELAQVARSVAVVSLFRPMPAAPADTVMADPAARLRTLLHAEYDSGRRRFVYAATVPPPTSGQDCDPYCIAYNTFCETVREFGLTPALLCHLKWSPEDIAQVPDRAVVFASHPQLALKIGAPDKNLSLISYTECRSTLDLAAGRVTTLYAGLEMMAQPAVDLLVSRRKANLTIAARTVRIEPEIFAAASQPDQSR